MREWRGAWLYLYQSIRVTKNEHFMMTMQQEDTTIDDDEVLNTEDVWGSCSLGAEFGPHRPLCLPGYMSTNDRTPTYDHSVSFHHPTIAVLSVESAQQSVTMLGYKFRLRHLLKGFNRLTINRTLP